MSVVVEASNLSKRFFLGERNQRAFFEDVAAKAASGLRRFLRPGQCPTSGSRRDFWALRDVSFQISEGQTLAIIGENGAGKSTLLKILSRITQPTTGTVKVYGRLASLLEVGTGFHPEFSGRDNIYLNGAMLGLSRQEVRARFDRIVDFSGIKDFIDTPVKNYSSGMYVRLAFSVAAHLNPEIVILDEVLAVGDAPFQQKCFQRMEEIIGEGHAAIIVSHAMANVRRMSQVCLWLKRGRIEMFGPAHEVVSEYEKQTTHAVVSDLEKQALHLDGSTEPAPSVRLSRWTVESRLATGPHSVVSGQERVAFRFEVESSTALPEGNVSVSVSDFQGLVLLTHGGRFPQANPGKFHLVLEVPLLPLRPGEYIATCTIAHGHHTVVSLRATPELTVLDEKNLGRSGYHGILNLPAKLSVHL
ncbi:MAG: ABC transporter ATP-binding protein [Verrucomicrobia bacterium]|nr:ABC transporter ATP-binding protein [Verrucomicrobiota bacterium]